MKTKNFKLSRMLTTVTSLTVVAVLGVAAVTHNIVRADQFDTQINNLKQQNATTNNQLGQLESEASSLSDAIHNLQTQIDSLQAQIDDNQRKSADMQAQIDAAQAELNHQKQVLGEDIKAMYVEGDISTLEMLATSKDISEFVDKQQSRISVQNKIKTTMDKITALKLQLAEQKLKLDELIQSDKKMQAELDAQRAEQNRILSLNQAQQATLDQQIRSNNSQIANLRAQQAAAIARLTGANGNSATGSSIVYRNMTGPQYCGGGYDYCGAGLDSWVSDPWGLHYARECVHYVANAVANRGYYIPYGLFAGAGNAYQWIGTTTSAGVASLVSNPQADDVVYMPIGSLGHVAIVDYVNGDGTLHVSQMNWYSGQYNTMDLVITSNLQFLRFHH